MYIAGGQDHANIIWGKSEIWLFVSPKLYTYMLQTPNLEDLLSNHRPKCTYMCMLESKSN